MKGRDGRSLRVAIITDTLVNAEPGSEADRLRLGLNAQGWGLVALPPTGLEHPATRDWLANIADLVGELLRHELAAVVLFDRHASLRGRLQVLEALARTGPVPHVVTDADLHVTAVLDGLAARAATFTAEPPSWTAAAIGATVS
jgi:hypothetical protein